MNLTEYTTSALEKYAAEHEIPQRDTRDIDPLAKFLLKELHSLHKVEEKINRGTYKFDINKSHKKGEENYFNFEIRDSAQSFKKKIPQSDLRHIMQQIDNEIS